MAKKDNQGYYVIGLILVAIILFRGEGMPFLGAFVTTCTNQELNTPNEVITYYSNSSVITSLDPVPYIIQVENVTITHQLASSQILSNETDLIILSKENVTCGDYIKYVKQSEPVTDTIYYNQKVGTDFNGTVYWCNARNNVIFQGDRVSFTDYVDEFIVCAIQDIVEPTEDEMLEDDSNDAYMGDSTTTNGITEDMTTTFTIPALEDFTQDRTIWYIGIISLGLVIYYFGFEKGPKKGFIKKRRNK